MKIVPVMKCKNLAESVAFYTDILGFRLKYPTESSTSPVVNVVKGESEIQLSILSGDGVFGSAINVDVENVDALFKEFVRKGLDTSAKKESPVHQSPLHQSWGTGEFYVNDPNGNTLRVRQQIGKE